MSDKCLEGCPIIRGDLRSALVGDTLHLLPTMSPDFEEHCSRSDECLTGPVAEEPKEVPRLFAPILRLLGKPATKMVVIVRCGRSQS